MEGTSAGVMQSLEAKQAQDTAAIQQAASAVAHDAALVQGEAKAFAQIAFWPNLFPFTLPQFVQSCPDQPPLPSISALEQCLSTARDRIELSHCAAAPWSV